MEDGIAPFRTAIEQISTIPDVKDLSARAILSEIGIDMTRFASNAHLISWACISRVTMKARASVDPVAFAEGSPWLKTTLVQCAWAAARTEGSYLQAQFHRIRARHVAKKAIMESILTAIYHML